MKSITRDQPQDREHDEQTATHMSRQLDMLRAQLSSMKKNDPMYLQQKKRVLDLEVRFEQLETQHVAEHSEKNSYENREKQQEQEQQHQKMQVDTPLFLFVPQQSLSHKQHIIPPDSFSRNQSTDSLDIATATPESEPLSVRTEVIPQRSINPARATLSSPRGSGLASQPKNQILLQERLKRLQVVLEEQEEEDSTADRLN